MGLFVELPTNTITFVTKSFSLFKSVCLIGAKALVLVTLSWLLVVKAIINFHVDICWRTMVWTVALISLPFRVINALQRERLLENQINEMQIQLDNLYWEKKEFEEQLHIAIKDCKIMETILTEIEEEHDKAIAQIDLLESELQDLKEENLQLNEIREKDLWDIRFRDSMIGRSVCDSSYDISLVPDYSTTSWKPSFTGNGLTLQDLLMHRDVWVDDGKGGPQNSVLLKPGSKEARPCPSSPRVISTNLMVDDTLERKRCVALSQSFFSMILSLLVGMIIWQAEDPCLPLVVALFTVVGMSLRSVVQFFSTIEIRPASDAVALLSFNCFILGTLTSPTLPTITRIVASLALTGASRVLSWFGFSS